MFEIVTVMTEIIILKHYNHQELNKEQCLNKL